VTHRKVPYVRDDRYQVTVFDRDHQRGSIIAVEVSFGFMEEPNLPIAVRRSTYRRIGDSGEFSAVAAFGAPQAAPISAVPSAAPRVAADLLLLRAGR